MPDGLWWLEDGLSAHKNDFLHVPVLNADYCQLFHCHRHRYLPATSQQRVGYICLVSAWLNELCNHLAPLGIMH